MRPTASTSHPYVLETPRGKLQGLEQRDPSGNPVLYRFAKIPYALPPTGQRRWRRPQALADSFTFNNPQGAPGDYTQLGPVCPQPYYPYDTIYIPNPAGEPHVADSQDEDCLYLNIWVPATQPPKKSGWPVQFQIHGGWLQIGSPNQRGDNDPFDLLANTTPRIIVCPGYRLNLFGFLAGEDLTSCHEDPAASNYGFWDQRCALEWVAKNIHLFGGDANNITVGGLSAGANSTFYQLNYDSRLPPQERLIKRIYLWSNAVAIQPSSTTSPVLTDQFNELCRVCNIPQSLAPKEKLRRLRSVSSIDLVAAISKMKMHTFRGSTDDSFINRTFLSSLHSGTFTTRLAQSGVSVLLGEVSDEKELYKLINPPSSHADLMTQLVNYYPEHVVKALVPLYELPPTNSTDTGAWAEVFSQIVADTQVHASMRGFTHVLLNPPRRPGVTPLPANRFHRYRISWRAKNLDRWVKPAVKVCHALDAPIWWASGWRADYTAADKEVIKTFLVPFGRYLSGDIGVAGSGRDEAEIGWYLDPAGRQHEGVADELWARGMEIWNAVWNAQKDLVAKETGESRL